MPDKVKIALFTPMSLCTVEGLNVLAEALEAEGALGVTHWGIEERGLSSFDRSEFVEKLDGSHPGIRRPTIARRSAIKWKGFFNADESTAQGLFIEFGRIEQPEKLATVYRFGSTLASHLRPVFGFVHPVYLGHGQEYNVAGRLDASEFRRFGPRSLCARTWFGKGLVEAIGRGRLDACDLAMRELDDGVVEVDLIPDPWTGAFDALNEPRTTAMAALADAGVFGNYAKSPFYEPGPRWDGVPVVDA